jgi:hypothetical protein
VTLMANGSERFGLYTFFIIEGKQKVRKVESGEAAIGEGVAVILRCNEKVGHTMKCNE